MIPGGGFGPPKPKVAPPHRPAGGYSNLHLTTPYAAAHPNQQAGGNSIYNDPHAHGHANPNPPSNPYKKGSGIYPLNPRGPSGGSSGGNNGGGGSNPNNLHFPGLYNGAGLDRAPKPKPPPSLKAWLGSDADYQNQLRNFQRAMSDFNSDLKNRTGSANTSYASSLKQMGAQKATDLQSIMNDFAARGLLKSGLFAQRDADYNKTYQSNLSDLGLGHKNTLSGLTKEKLDFSRQQALAKEQARQDAAARRAAKYGL